MRCQSRQATLWPSRRLARVHGRLRAHHVPVVPALLVVERLGRARTDAMSLSANWKRRSSGRPALVRCCSSETAGKPAWNAVRRVPAPPRVPVDRVGGSAAAVCSILLVPGIDVLPAAVDHEPRARAAMPSPKGISMQRHTAAAAAAAGHVNGGGGGGRAGAVSSVAAPRPRAAALASVYDVLPSCCTAHRLGVEHVGDGRVPILTPFQTRDVHFVALGVGATVRWLQGWPAHRARRRALLAPAGRTR